MSGSVRAAAFHPVAGCNYAAAAGLDRHVRVYDVKKMACVSSIYCKQKLTALLFDTEPPVASTADVEEDEAWLGIQEAKAAKKKKAEEDAAGQEGGEHGEGNLLREGDETSAGKPLSRKGFNAVKKRKVAPSKKGPASNKGKGLKKKK